MKTRSPNAKNPVIFCEINSDLREETVYFHGKPFLRYHMEARDASTGRAFTLSLPRTAAVKLSEAMLACASHPRRPTVSKWQKRFGLTEQESRQLMMRRPVFRIARTGVGLNILYTATVAYFMVPELPATTAA